MPAVKEGRLIRLTVPDNSPSGAQGWFFNLRRDKFQDPKVRRAAADAIGRLVVLDGAPALIAYLGEFDANDRDQLAGIWALGNLGAHGLQADVRKQVLDVLEDAGAVERAVGLAHG